MFHFSRTKRQGFTLIELLVVIAIIGILSTLAIVALGSARQKARDSKRVADLNQIGKALELYYNDNNAYPTIITPGQPIAFGSTTYLAQVPSNPTPRNDGNCPNNNYTYSGSTSGNAYTIGTCLGGSAGSLSAGGAFISSANGSGVAGCGQSLVTDLDGNSYATVQIGAQCWMQQNLRVGVLKVGHPSNVNIIEKHCYGDDDANCLTDGALYEWGEAMQGVTTNGAQGICPTGWHIPTHDEWTTLERAICTSGTCATDFPYDVTTFNQYRGTNEGTKLKAGGSSGFNSSTFVLAGNRQTNGSTFLYRTLQNDYWTSTEYDAGTAWSRDIGTVSAAVWRQKYNKSYGFSVRCIQN